MSGRAASWKAVRQGERRELAVSGKMPFAGYMHDFSAIEKTKKRSQRAGWKSDEPGLRKV